MLTIQEIQQNLLTEWFVPSSIPTIQIALIGPWNVEISQANTHNSTQSPNNYWRGNLLTQDHSLLRQEASINSDSILSRVVMPSWVILDNGPGFSLA